MNLSFEADFVPADALSAADAADPQYQNEPTDRAITAAMNNSVEIPCLKMN
jgi:hypothetical protein